MVVKKLKYTTLEGYTHAIFKGNCIQFIGTFDDCCWYLDYYTEV